MTHWPYILAAASALLVLAWVLREAKRDAERQKKARQEFRDLTKMYENEDETRS